MRSELVKKRDASWKRWRTVALLAIVGLLIYGYRVYAEAAKEKKAEKEEAARKAEARKDAPPTLDDLLDQQMEGTTQMMQGMMQLLLKNGAKGPNLGDLSGMMDQMMKINQKQMQMLRKMQPPLPQPGLGFGGFGNRSESAQFQRLGVEVKAPDDALAEQLDLPKGQGLVLTEIGVETPASKAGLRASDILLELEGKAVSRDPAALAKALEAIKANKPVNAVVFRKGRKTDVKGLTLPETPAEPAGGFGGANPFPQNPGFPLNNPFRAPLPNFPQLPVQPIRGVGLPRAGGFGLGGQGNAPAIPVVAAGTFTATYQEGQLTIDVSGTSNNGAVAATEIVIKDGPTTLRFGSVDQVPEAYRDKVKTLLGKSGRAQAAPNK